MASRMFPVPLEWLGMPQSDRTPSPDFSQQRVWAAIAVCLGAVGELCSTRKLDSMSVELDGAVLEERAEPAPVAHGATNARSPLNGPSLLTFASTAGWNLGEAVNGGEYFNKLPIVELTPEQEALATRLAKSTYRPCCDNSTFFQDCNHGSALLGLLELGAAQGLSEDELFSEALAFNSFWFPDNYLRTALYFKVVKGKDWAEVDPRLVMSAR